MLIIPASIKSERAYNEIGSMVEDKASGIMENCDDACSRSSKEGDSLLITGNSPNMTSPSSASALSGSALSVDEGVDIKRTEDPNVRKRNLFKVVKKRLPDVQEEPIDLSTKNRKSGVCSRRICYDNLATNAAQNSSSKKSGELVIKERMPPKVTSKKAQMPNGLCSRGNSPTHSPLNTEIPSSLAPTYMPWSYAPGPALNFRATTLQSLWHPALFMSQAARHLTPSIQSLVPYSPTQIGSTSTPFTSSAGALHQLYGQNVLAEFSRICSQTQELYDGHLLPRQHGSNSGKKEYQKTTKIASERRECPHEKFARENGVRIKEERAPSPEQINFRKRKHVDVPPDSNFHPIHDEYASVSDEMRMKEDHGTERTDSPPTMISNMYSIQSSMEVQQPDNSRLVPKPVDFKPCRFPCNECGRTYATVGGLLKHSKTHQDPENSNNFKCRTCDKEYNSLGALKMHIRTHTLPCKCHICGKAFSRTWLLQGHIRTHTGEKPYQCSVCSRAFADRSNLRAHMQTHESVKRYACTSCDKTFSRISLLNRHSVSGCVDSTLHQAHPNFQALSD